MSHKYDRTLDDVTKSLIQAKHKEDDVKPVTQIFYYPSAEETAYGDSNIKLFQVDENFIQKLESGDCVVFKGENDEKVVLCTEDETFEVKEGEISNSLALVPELMMAKDIPDSQDTHQLIEKKIVSIQHKYLEVRPTFPRLIKMRHLLSESSYKGPENEEEDQHEGLYMSELLDRIQASEAEIKEGLADIMACCINDKWRLLDKEYESRMLSHVVNLIEEQSWTQFSINVKEAKSLLRNLVPDFVLDHLLICYGKPDDTDANIVYLREDRVCQCFAEMLLRAAEGKFRHNEFMMAWKQCLPQGMDTNLDHLRGLALIEQEGIHQKIINLFPEYELPENVAERFRLLFKMKEKWTFHDIEPYIKKLETQSLNVNLMLTKFSRPSTLNGVRVYGARHAK